MPAVRNMRKRLDYLVRTTGRSENEIVAQAVEKGLAELYLREISEAYLSGSMDRQKAVTELGPDRVEELDFAQTAIEEDVAWGLRRD